jgi:hypothetical protein
MHANLNKQLTEKIRSGGPGINLKAISTGLSLAEIGSGIVVGWVALPNLSRRLSAIAGHLHVKYNDLKPPNATQKLPTHHIGDIVMGAKYTSNVTDSNVGAVAVGDHAHAKGTTMLTGALTQDHHVEQIKSAQQALVNDQEVLDRIDSHLYEALGQFLRLAREFQVEQKSMADVQAKMKETLDNVWCNQAAKGLRPQVLPRTLEVAEALVKNPAMAEVAKKLLGA